MKTNRDKRNWMIDAVLLVGFLLAFFLDLTGLAFHQWLGIAMGLLAGYHFLLHWTWVRSVTLRLTGRIASRVRYCYLMDAALMLGFLVILVTGLAISSWFASPLGGIAVRDAHVGASVITLVLIVAKIGMHWRWIVRTSRQALSVPRSTPAAAASSLQPVPASAQMDRRAFLKLMAVVSVPAVLAVSRVLGTGWRLSGAEGLKQATSASSPQSPSQPATPTQAFLQQPSPATDQASGGISSGACVVRCDNGCLYPGRCPRYVDRNGNNRCDMGECM